MSWTDVLKNQIAEKTVIKLDEGEPKTLLETITEVLDKEMIREQLQENERQKRKHRTILIWFVFPLTVIQLAFLNIIIGRLFFSDFIQEITEKELSLILGFVKYYIGATIVEILGMLLFIIQSCFDKTLSELFKSKKK